MMRLITYAHKMKKFALREILHHKNLPKEVQKEWKEAYKNQFKGKVPKLFQCESLFSGSNPDYVILTDYSYKSTMKRLKCHGFFYNSQYPQVSELKEIFISPDYRYLELPETRLSQLLKKILMTFLFPTRYCFLAFDLCDICFFNEQPLPNGTGSKYCNHSKHSDWCPFFRFDKKIIKKNIRFRNYVFKYYNWKHIFILGVYNLIFGIPNNAYRVDLCWNCHYNKLTKRFHTQCLKHLHNNEFEDCPEYKFVWRALYLRIIQRFQYHIREIQLRLGTAQKYEIAFAPQFSESLKDMIAKKYYEQGTIPDEEDLQVEADELLNYLQSNLKSPSDELEDKEQ